MSKMSPEEQKEHQIINRKKWYLLHREDNLAKKKEWRDSHPEKVREQNNKRAEYKHNWHVADYKKNKDSINKQGKEYRDKHKEEINSKRRMWREEHKEEYKEQRKLNREKHKEEYNKAQRLYCMNHIDQIRETRRKNSANHLEQHRADQHKRRALKLSCPGGGWSPKEERALMEDYGYRCAYCGKSATTIDHVVPLAKHGANSIDNAVPCCSTCNSSKGAKTLIVWMWQQKKRSEKLEAQCQ